MDQTDAELVRRAQAELPYRHVAFEALVKRHYPSTRKLIAGIVGSPDEADSLAQDTMLRMMHGLPKLEDVARFPAWLRRIAVNVTKTYLTRRNVEIARRASYENALTEASQYGPDSPTAGAPTLAELLEPLTADERVIVTFKVLQDYEFTEIAEILDLSLSAAKMRYYRAIEKLARTTEAADAS